VERTFSASTPDMNSETFRYGTSRNHSSELSLGNLAIDGHRLRVASYCRVSTEEKWKAETDSIK
jgi:hypothetical protein